MSPPVIAFFISGHGYGHGVRQCALINGLPPEVRPAIFSPLPEAFFREELSRPFEFHRIEMDCGCVQPDSVRIDIPSTLARYARIEFRRKELVEQAVRLLRSAAAGLVIGDIPPLAFVAASRAGLPSLAVANFNWVDIYRPFVEDHPEHRGLLERMREDYRLAGTYVRLEPGVPTDVFPRQVEGGLLSRRGSARRAHLARTFGLDPQKRWCLVYMGSHGVAGVDWRRLELLEDWQFLGLYPVPGRPSNYRRVRVGEGLGYADLTASCDAVLGKLGYGLVAECLALGKPVLYIGRENFAEFPCLQAALQARGQGFQLPWDSFRRLDIGAVLDGMAERAFAVSRDGDVERAASVVANLAGLARNESAGREGRRAEKLGKASADW